MKKSINILLLIPVSVIFWACSPKETSPELPKSCFNLLLKAPVTTWDEALPLGNGLMGGLLWGENNIIRLSLDRGDLWDERTHGGENWWKEHTFLKGAELVSKKEFALLRNWWDDPYRGVTPTKLPAGRIEIKLPGSETVKDFELNLSNAEGTVLFNSALVIKALYSATDPVALLLIKGLTPDSVNLLSTMDVYRRSISENVKIGIHAKTMDKLGYPEAQKGKSGNAQWYIQEAAQGLKYCVYTESKQTGNETLFAITIASTDDASDIVAVARQRCTAALQKGYHSILEAHSSWWKKFWQQSSVNIPDTAIQKQYNLVQYFYGAASRSDAPPIPLQGVWTSDNGELPPWKGDYHNDLNTQMTYIAYQTAGRFDEGASYLNFLWDRRKVFQDFARDFYGTGGLACPGVMSYSGQPLGGWGQYTMSPTNSAWSAHLFYLHWLYTADEIFLKERAYPWCSGVGECMLGLLKSDAKGIPKLPLSSSPEIFGNSPEAWLQPNSNYDLMCLKILFLSLTEMATACNKESEAKKWDEAASALGSYHIKSDGTLMIDAVTELSESHRHLSNIIGLYPFNLITKEGSEEDNRMIESSLRHWDTLGTSQWCGYSFSWMSCLQARVGNSEAALKNLEIYVKAFILRNGFHVNGDQTKSGYSSFTYRPFTLEGNFLASQAIHEMLLQSWSTSPGKINTGVIRIFPATPDKWADVSFSNLRTEGGHKVTAIRKNNKTAWFCIEAGKTGTIRIKDNFEGRVPVWSLPNIKKNGDLFEVNLSKGQKLEAVFDK
jgi:alpha-L-fucosidase 2